jgi:predicted nucleic acid-binding protein
MIRATARPLTITIHTQAVMLARDHELSFYDSLIVAAALDASCEVLCSEDLQHGQKFENPKVENPFRRQVTWACEYQY